MDTVLSRIDALALNGRSDWDCIKEVARAVDEVIERLEFPKVVGKCLEAQFADAIGSYEQRVEEARILERKIEILESKIGRIRDVCDKHPDCLYLGLDNGCCVQDDVINILNDAYVDDEGPEAIG